MTVVILALRPRRVNFPVSGKSGAMREPMIEREVPVADPVLDDAVRSLRAWVVFLGLVALAALAVAVYAVVTKEEESDAQRGATVGQVQNLQRRVDDLQRRLDDVPTKDQFATTEDVQKVASAQDDLSKRIARVEKQASDSGDTDQIKQSVDDLQQAVDGLTQDVDKLNQRVDDLEQRQQEQDASNP
jgi:peptidoglycan hydrolase CwlO-like protein